MTNKLKIILYKILAEKYKKLYYGAVYSYDYYDRYSYRNFVNPKIISTYYEDIKKYSNLYIQYSNKEKSSLVIDKRYVKGNSINITTDPFNTSHF